VRLTFFFFLLLVNLHGSSFARAPVDSKWETAGSHHPLVRNVLGPVLSLVFTYHLPHSAFGPGIQLSLQLLGSLFQPGGRKILLASFSGCFQAASFVFLISGFLVNAGLSLRAFLAIYSTLAVGATIGNAMMLSGVGPARRNKQRRPDAARDDAAVKGAGEKPGPAGSSSITPAVPTLRSQLFSLPYLAVILFMSMHVLTMQFFVLSVNEQLDRKAAATGASQATADRYSRISVLASGLAFIVAPAVGFALKRAGFAVVFSGVTLLMLFHNATMMRKQLDGLLIAGFLAYRLVTFFFFFFFSFLNFLCISQHSH
jgi:hypothetical protein